MRRLGLRVVAARRTEQLIDLGDAIFQAHNRGALANTRDGRLTRQGGEQALHGITAGVRRARGAARRRSGKRILGHGRRMCPRADRKSVV